MFLERLQLKAKATLFSLCLSVVKYLTAIAITYAELNSGWFVGRSVISVISDEK